MSTKKCAMEERAIEAVREQIREVHTKGQALVFPCTPPSSECFTKLCGAQEDGSCTLTDCPRNS